MSTNQDEFNPTVEQKDVLDQLVTTYYVLINSLTGLHPSEIKMEDRAEDVFDEQEVYGFVLLKMHLYHNIPVEYKPYTEFDTFPTLSDAYNYIAERVLLTQGLMSDTDI